MEAGRDPEQQLSRRDKRASPIRGAALAVLIVAATACAPPITDKTTGLQLRPIAYSDLPGWYADRQAEALPALRRSCAVRARRAAGGDVRFGKAASWRAACAAGRVLAAGDDAAARAYFETWFRPHRVIGAEGERGLFTGYYEPELAGAQNPSAAFAVPLYGRPPDLVTVRLADFQPGAAHDRLAGRVVGGVLKPYFDRAEIDAGALAGRGLELFWAADPIAAFFLHIQGSGVVRLRDGARVRLGYAAANGRPYTAIGRALVSRGALALDEVSLQSIRAWLRAHPAQAQAVMAENASYVFFREVSGAGPLGTQGVPLSAGRSIAVDPRMIPLGLPMWIDTAHPSPGFPPLRRLAVAQDTGGAIRGAVRADLFWGAGAEAEGRAGRMRSQGRYFALIPRQAAVAAAR